MNGNKTYIDANACMYQMDTAYLLNKGNYT